MAVQPCECRSHYKRCDKPLEVCFLLDEVGDTFVARGEARPVDLSEAAEILKIADAHGLVHLSLYMPDHRVFALCSCCSCCCHDLQIIRRYHRPELMVRSKYAAVTDPDACTHCGACVERCIFGARREDNGQVRYEPEACMGCGLCVSVCPEEATTMVPRSG